MTCISGSNNPPHTSIQKHSNIAYVGGSNDPPPEEFANKTNANNKIIYEIRINGRGNPVIEDSRGFTYNFQKSRKGKSKIPKYTYWHCIKTQNKAIRKKINQKNCQSYLKIENFEKGARNMIVTRMGDGKDHGHNHNQDYNYQMKTKINEELKKETLNHPWAKSSDIIKKMLSENGNFCKFIESKSSIPEKQWRNSMSRFIQRIRKMHRDQMDKEKKRINKH